jgi:predicted CXXCH cytochrome family protein
MLHLSSSKRSMVTVKHAPVNSATGCRSCHAPHAAKNKYLLVQKDGDLASPAMKRRGPPRSPSTRTPLMQNACDDCHNPHGSNFAGMMKRQNG